MNSGLQPTLHQKRLLLVDDQPDRGEATARRLERSGLLPPIVLTEARRLLRGVEELRPDLLVISLTSPRRDLIDSLAVVARLAPTPVALFGGPCDPDFVTRAVVVGVGSYNVGSIEELPIEPALLVAMAQHEGRRRLERELERSRDEARERQLLERAKLILVARERLSEPQAHKRLLRAAMDQNLKLSDIAERIVTADAGRT